MKWWLAALVVGVVALAGCGSKDDKIAKQIVGTWTMETPKNAKSGPFSGMKVPIGFKADGTCVIKFGPMQQGRPWRVKDGMITIGDGQPQPIHELTAHRFVYGDPTKARPLTR
jgi:hypothetical protein